jgi:aspartate/methionine/tyrosine aminotransferase
VPGEAFFSGPAGAGLIRFSYAKTDEDLDMACHKIQQLNR